ncbi:MAG: MlaD family protein [Candidatus Omnitrophica bacterium]|nr:MlaD family protein [Candidatus Omnitrophota bacterium]MDD5488697.1 MlaD family protein [Candidatus Omnitrophota bacterium]
MRIPNEIKAGMVILLAAAVTVLFFIKTADFRSKTYTVETYFVYAGDLQSDAVVKLSGVEVGRLKALEFIYEEGTKVKCVLEINEDARLRNDSTAYIGTAGFVGDAYIGITPGTSDKFAEAGSIIASEDPVQMRLIMKKADMIADNLNNILVQVKELVADNKKGVDSIVSNLEDTTENFKEFSADLKKHPWKLLFKGE